MVEECKYAHDIEQLKTDKTVLLTRWMMFKKTLAN